jgi:hypothetical protein
MSGAELGYEGARLRQRQRALAGGHDQLVARHRDRFKRAPGAIPREFV